MVRKLKAPAAANPTCRESPRRVKYTRGEGLCKGFFFHRLFNIVNIKLFAEVRICHCFWTNAGYKNPHDVFAL